MGWTLHFTRYPPVPVLLGMLIQSKVPKHVLPFATLPENDVLLSSVRRSKDAEDVAFKQSFAREAAHFGWN